MKNIDHTFKFVVLGAGTAGWLTALYLKKYFPETSITVVASDDIGILGAGEGVTPHFISFLNELDISISDLIVHADATIKNGIKFTNWHGDNSSYYHPFCDNDGLDHTLYSDLNFSNFPLMDLDLISNDIHFDTIDLSSLCSEENKVRFTPCNLIWKKDFEPSQHFNSLGTYALHFNAVKLAKLLETIGIERGVQVINDKVIDFGSDDVGNIDSLYLEQGLKLNSDFVFDCSGFKRFIIGKHLKSKWKTYKDYLPVKSAIPFFEPIENDIPPYTEAIAMKYGWMWKIPTRERSGCGYVFDSDLISADQAKEELELHLNKEIEVPKVFNFEAGCYEKQWEKNCMAVGLSAGFIEPLEATSIWVTIQSLHSFIENIKGVVFDDQHAKDRLNERMTYINEKILEFVSFHYLGNRTDTEFWKNFKENNKILDSLKNMILEFENSLPSNQFLNKNDIFTHKSWYAVGAGLRKFNSENARNEFLSLTQGIKKSYYQNFKSSYLKNIYINKQACLNHAEYIEYIINNYRR